MSGVLTSDGETVSADQKLDGGPSVRYDAVVLLLDDDGARRLSTVPAARDFVSDAFAHCKFIGHTPEALTLVDAVGLGGRLDGGFVPLAGNGTGDQLLDRCAQLRFWDREATLG